MLLYLEKPNKINNRYKQAYVDYHVAYQIDTRTKQAQAGFNRLSSLLKQTLGNNWREKLPPYPAIPNTAFNNSAKPASKPAEEVKIQEKVKTQVKEETTKSKDAPKKEQNCNAAAEEKVSKSPAEKSEPKTDDDSKEAQEQAKKEAQDKKREEVKRKLFEKVKNDGNMLVKAKNYQKAIDCYDK